jgi:hypothetical protein
MKVDINHKEGSQGLVFKKPIYNVTVKVQFSPEEITVLSKKGMGEYVVVERDWDMSCRERARKDPDYFNTLRPMHLYIADLLKGPDTYSCETTIEAKNYENKLMGGLKQLKEFIQGNSTPAESKSFEL